MKTRQELIPGTGLPLAYFLALLLLSVTLFMTVGGLLWRAPREASHVMRFAVSYAAVIPLGALMLLALRRFSWARLVTSTFSVWAIKMVITAGLYQAFARGTATNLQAVAPPASAITGHGVAPRPDYHAASAPSFASGALRGHLRRGGKPVRDAVVFLDGPAPGRPAAPAAQVSLEITGSRYAAPLYLAHVDDEIRLVNHDGTLHTAHFTGAGRLPATQPLPAGAAPSEITFPEPGVFRVRCDNHPGEVAWLVVVDHPYAVRTAADGSFSIEGVPAGGVRLVAVTVEGATARQVAARAVITAGAAAVTDLDFDSGQEI